MERPTFDQASEAYGILHNYLCEGHGCKDCVLKGEKRCALVKIGLALEAKEIKDTKNAYELFMDELTELECKFVNDLMHLANKHKVDKDLAFSNMVNCFTAVRETSSFKEYEVK